MQILQLQILIKFVNTNEFDPRMENIGLIGWNGNYNVGDDAMTSVIIRYLMQHKVGARFYFYTDKSTLAEYVDKNQKLEIKELPCFTFIRKIPFIRSIALRYIFPYFFSNNKDLLLIGGGSIIHRAKLSLLYTRIIKLIRKKNQSVLIGAIGISIGPFTNEEDKIAAKLVLENMDFFVVRDLRSYQLAKQMNLKNRFKIAPDLALLLPQLSNESFCKTGNFGNYIGLSLRSGYIDSEKNIWLSNLIQSVLNNNPGYTLKLFTFCAFKGQNDMDDNARFINLLPASLQKRVLLINYSKKPLDFYKEIYYCDIMVCMRLHAAIISYAVNTKFVMLSYHQKCIDFAEETGLPPEYLLSEQVSLDEAVNLLQKLLNEKKTIFNKTRCEVINKVKDHFSFIPVNN